MHSIPKDFFFSKCLKDKAYCTKPGTVNGLKEETVKQCLTFPDGMFCIVVKSIGHRYWLCFENDGRHEIYT